MNNLERAIGGIDVLNLLENITENLKLQSEVKKCEADLIAKLKQNDIYNKDRDDDLKGRSNPFASRKPERDKDFL